MTHGPIEVCEFCPNIIAQCRCPGPHERIRKGVCLDCKAKGHRPGAFKEATPPPVEPEAPAPAPLVDALHGNTTISLPPAPLGSMELKPCPFCGSPATRDPEYLPWVGCSNTECVIYANEWIEEEAWNRRAQASPMGLDPNVRFGLDLILRSYIYTDGGVIGAAKKWIEKTLAGEGSPPDTAPAALLKLADEMADQVDRMTNPQRQAELANLTDEGGLLLTLVGNYQIAREKLLATPDPVRADELTRARAACTRYKGDLATVIGELENDLKILEADPVRVALTEAVAILEKGYTRETPAAVERFKALLAKEIPQ